MIGHAPFYNCGPMRMDADSPIWGTGLTTYIVVDVDIIEKTDWSSNLERFSLRITGLGWPRWPSATVRVSSFRL